MSPASPRISERPEVETACPVCEHSLAPSLEHCPSCGFPLALVDEARGEPSGATVPPAELVPVPSPPVPAPPSSQGGENAEIAHRLEERTDLLRSLGGPTPDVTPALCEAAVREAKGDAAGARDLLLAAEGRLEGESQALLRSRLVAIEERVRVLEEAGLRLGVADELRRMTGGEGAGDPAHAVVYLLEIAKHLSRLESTWKGLTTLVAETSALRAEATELGIPCPDVPPRLRGPEGAVALPRDLGEDELETLVPEVARTLVLLQEALVPALDEELGLHARTIETAADGHPHKEAARTLHGSVAEQLRQGRLSDAVRGMASLRTTIAALETPVVPPPPPTPAPVPAPPPSLEPSPGIEPTPPASPPRPPPEVMLAMLAKKAQSLAAHVRSLPAESERSRWAAEQIRAVTLLLKARRLADADVLLSRLIQELAPGGGPR